MRTACATVAREGSGLVLGLSGGLWMVTDRQVRLLRKKRMEKKTRRRPRWPQG